MLLRPHRGGTVYPDAVLPTVFPIPSSDSAFGSYVLGEDALPGDGPVCRGMRPV
ncbi:hypothetical protein [Pelagicoccus mobilis]|uniref:Uncharacterized protein n=1 Tax=Pelagicoccus mobilis TaxID=415221 RepID=A0A934VR56_9BACT|nr:hypothetical protein [Pelagicoccus mobilis]MBK1877268.1 hypothetical protein [Pelagicoccus mobilis]